eukprot:1627330-Lingulodinium_polyedra.AAC.1
MPPHRWMGGTGAWLRRSRCLMKYIGPAQTIRGCVVTPLCANAPACALRVGMAHAAFATSVRVLSEVRGTLRPEVRRSVAATGCR